MGHCEVVGQEGLKVAQVPVIVVWRPSTSILVLHLGGNKFDLVKGKALIL